jgi:hypothetical protein
MLMRAVLCLAYLTVRVSTRNKGRSKREQGDKGRSRASADTPSRTRQAGKDGGKQGAGREGEAGECRDGEEGEEEEFPSLSTVGRADSSRSGYRASTNDMGVEWEEEASQILGKGVCADIKVSK